MVRQGKARLPPDPDRDTLTLRRLQGESMRPIIIVLLRQRMGTDQA
jgi:hypothetical protein